MVSESDRHIGVLPAEEHALAQRRVNPAPAELGPLGGVEHNVEGRGWGEEGGRVITTTSGNQDVSRANGAAAEFECRQRQYVSCVFKAVCRAQPVWLSD